MVLCRGNLRIFGNLRSLCVSAIIFLSVKWPYKATGAYCFLFCQKNTVGYDPLKSILIIIKHVLSSPPIGIGADDAFIFLKIWQCVISDRMKTSGAVVALGPSTSSFAAEANVARSDTLVGIMASTLRHAALSMLVTSLTTAAAFYASYVSSITAVRCFG